LETHLTEKTFGGIWDLVKMYNEKNHPQIIRLVQRFIGNIDAVTSTAVRFLDIYVYQTRELIDYKVSFKPEEGHFSYEQLLPFTWYSFGDTPDLVKLMDLLPDDNQAQAVDVPTDFDLIKFQYDLLDAINTLSGALSVQTLIPPFSASAVIAGNSYIKTFDGKFYEFGGNGCSYLLTADFMYKRFSVMANYNGGQMSSVSVTSDSHLIEIHGAQDNNQLIKITLDRRNVELPIVYDYTSVTREGAQIIVENTEGLRLVCNMAQQVCTVTVSGWYFGKTGGLFGIYDNEPSNDWMTPERDVVPTLKEFVQSWQMDQGNVHCPVKDRSSSSASTGQSSTNWEREECRKFFEEDTSTLRPCFSTVDPRPYMKMCLSDIKKVRNRPQKMSSGVCLSTAAYVAECRSAGVNLWLPYQCVNCTDEQGQLMAVGEDRTLNRQRGKGTDVVFLVEKKASCGSDFYREHVSVLPGQIDRELKSVGLVNNRFSIVGFGGQGVLAKPHIVTSGSRIFSTAEHAATALKTGYDQDGEGVSDMFDALKFAVDVPFRSAVGKTVVLVTCDTQGHDDGSFYGDAMTILDNHDITLHHLTPMQLALRGGRVAAAKASKVARKVYGYDKHAAFQSDGRPDKALRKQMRNPKDYLSTLALENDGAVFDSNKLTEGGRGGGRNNNRRMVAKRAGYVFSKHIAAQGRPSPCQQCHCWVDADGTGRLKCQKCLLPFAVSLNFNKFKL